ncbi:putative fimbrial protein Z, transcriptional regulator (LuxR/UhpA family) [unidentified eubacterium SCB49]|nr:putative fimbrial protein Z, transcriptional regulator (LuxR/UhpA family) [unidentified eubacterium SCB49]
MFTKILISDDLGSINYGVAGVLADLGIPEIIQVHYCDDAYLKIKKSALNNTPIELLITDLSFVPDHREQNFKSGEELVALLKKEHPELKIIVYSVENQTQLIKKMMLDHKVDGYVCKGRNGLVKLKEAIECVDKNQTFISPEIKMILNKKEKLEIDDFDIELIRLLSLGKSQDEISSHLKQNNISPNSLSSIEKRLNRLRSDFKAKNAIHLVSIAKDLSLI